MSEELCFMSATALREQIARRDLSPVEITRAVLDRAERLQPELNCFITLCRDRAMRRRATAEQAVMRGAAQSLLHGVPLTCKDLVNTEGVRTTFGSRLLNTTCPARMRKPSRGCAARVPS